MDVRLKYILDHFSALYGPIDHDLIGWGNDNALVSIPDTGIAQLDAQHIVTPEEVKRVPFDGTDLPVLSPQKKNWFHLKLVKQKLALTSFPHHSISCPVARRSGLTRKIIMVDIPSGPACRLRWDSTSCRWSIFILRS